MTRLVLCVALLAAMPAAVANTRTAPDDRWAAWDRHRALEQSSPLKGLTWRSIGPTVQGGRIVDIEVHPNDPYTFYVAYASGGVWKTTNNGVSFVPLSDALPTTISGDIAIDPNDPQVLWIGTGEPNSSRSSYAGLGVLVSRDGGATFTPSGLDDADRIARVRVDPTNSERIFVAVQGALYTPGGRRGMFRSDDGGKTWKHVLKDKGEWTGAIDFVFDPRNSNVVYAAMWERSRSAFNFVEGGKGSGVYKSTDGGDTWARLPGFPMGEHIGRIGLAISPAAPDRLYASIDNQEPLPTALMDAGDRPLSPARLKTMSKEEFLRQDPDEIEIFIRGADFDPSIDAAALVAKIESGELTMEKLKAKLVDGNAALFNTDIRGIDIWRSDNGGDSWSRANDKPIRDFTFTYGYYFGEIRVAPDNADRVYILGVPTAISEDGGKTFSGRINQPDVHVDHHAFEFDPANPRRILNGNDGGLDVSYDGGATWLKLDRQSVGQSYALTVDMETPYNVYTGMQDNGTWKGSSMLDPSRPGGFWDGGGDGWTFLNGGDGMQIQVDPRDSSVVYTGYQFGWYQRSGKDGGEVRPRPALTDPALRYNWNTPIVLSEHSPNTLYFGANKLFRSLDQGKTWRAISGDLTRDERRGDVPYATITTISESPREFGLLAAGTDDGLVWVSEDGGVQWREITRGLAKGRWISRVVLSAHQRNRLYVTQTGYRLDDQTAYVWVSEDLGRSWRSLATGLPNEPVNVIEEDPVNNDLVYVGTGRGVYASWDRGQGWMALQQGLPNVPVHDLVVHPRDRELVAGTHGRSVWITDVLPLQDLTGEVRAKPLHVFYVPEVTASRGWRSTSNPWFAHTDKPDTAVFHYWAKESGPVTMTVADADKQAVRKIEMQAIAGINRFEYDLKVDGDLAIPAEAARVKKAAEKATESAKETATGTASAKGELAKFPLAESQRLGHPLYITAGDYTITLSQGTVNAEAKLKVNAAKAFEPRQKPKYKLRGR